MAAYRITDGQSIFDVALQKYGSVEQAIKIVQDNPAIVNMNNANLSGAIVTVDDVQNQVVKTFLINRRNLNTSNPIIKDGYSYNNGFSEGFFS
jgi:hypothetical protein